MDDIETFDSPLDDGSTLDHPLESIDSILKTEPTQIGPYKILAKLGEGGFGVVYEAQQEKPVKRRVALKVIKPGMDSKRVIARFEAERQALALMTHPNIAKVLDGGLTERGLPYFVMELVRGEPITEFCDRNKMPLNERLKLLIPVCHAVQHAHAKAVIHRDLKPSNILVGYDHEGHPQSTVIDFGVAKALNQQLTEKTIYTQAGQMIGTPEYMSPEQAEMSGVDIDTRTDVYSLGVVLYELLTGMLPFGTADLRSKAYGEMQRIIREQDPPRPSTKLSSALSAEGTHDQVIDAAKRRHMSEGELSKHLRGELDWVVMKCLEKDRDRRYATPNALADELGHYLANEPVEARPPSAGYRLGKLINRNKSVFAGCVSLIIILAVSTATITYFFLSTKAALAAEKFAVAKSVEANKARSIALDSEMKQRIAAEEAELVSKSILSFYDEQISNIDPLQSQVQNNFANSTSWGSLPLRDFLINACSDIDNHFSDNPAIAARTKYTLGKPLLALGDSWNSRILMLSAVELQEQHGISNHKQYLRHMITISEILLNGSLVGDATIQKNDLQLAQKRLTTAIDSIEKSEADSLDSIRAKVLLIALRMLNLGPSKTFEWLQLMNEASEISAESSMHLGPNHPVTLESKLTIAGNLLNAQRFEAGIKLLDEILISTDDLEELNYIRILSTQQLFRAEFSQGNFEIALRHSQRVSNMSEQLFGFDHDKTFETWLETSTTIRIVEDLENAINFLSTRLEPLENPRRLRTPTAALLRSHYSTFLKHGKRADEAIRQLNESIEIFESTLDSYSMGRNDLLNDVSKMYETTGNYEMAISSQTKQYWYLEQHVPSDDTQLISILDRICRLYNKLNDARPNPEQSLLASEWRAKLGAVTMHPENKPPTP